MKMITEHDGFDIEKAKAGVDPSNFISNKPKDTDNKVSNKRDTAPKYIDNKKDTKKDTNKRTPPVKKNTTVDRIDREKDAIEKAIINAIHFYTGVIGASSSDIHNLNEEYFEKLFLKRLREVWLAKYCDMIIRIANPTRSLAKAVMRDRKKFDYFLSRNGHSSSSVEYLQNVFPEKNRRFKIKTLQDLFNGDFYDYVVEDFQQDTKNILRSRHITEPLKSGFNMLGFIQMSDEYIINLVNIIYDNKIYGNPQSYLK